MKKGLVLYLFVCFVFTGGNNNAQEAKTENENPNYYSTITIGGIELFSFSIGKYITQDLTIAAKWSKFGVQGSGIGGPTVPTSIGFGINYFLKKFLIFRYFSADYLIIYGSVYEGDGSEVVIGNCTNIEKGLGFIFEAGVGVSDTNHSRLLVGPIIKIGINYNFY